jgi:hypothetical protein
MNDMNAKLNWRHSHCQWPDGCENPVENQDTGLCASHGAYQRKLDKDKTKGDVKRSAIAKVSEKQQQKLAVYSRMKGPWIKNKRCAVFKDRMAVDIHHKMGKVGYADKWAYENDIPLLIDQRFWLAVSRDGHNEITRRSQWALDKGFSLPRNTYRPAA